MNIINCLIPFLIVNDYLRFLLGFSLIDKIFPFICLLIFLWFAIKRNVMKKYKRGFLFVLLLYITLLLLFSFSSFGVFAYEIFKLLTFFYFIPVAMFYSKEEVESSFRILLRLSYYYFAFNLIIIILQYIFGSSVVEYFGVPSEIYLDPQKAGRYMGLFSNLPALSVSALLLYILTDMFSGYDYTYKTKTVMGITILLSTSKVTILMFVLYLLYKKKNDVDLMKFFFVFIFCAFCLFFYLSSSESFANKLGQFDYILSVNDVTSYYDSQYVDLRLSNYLLSFKIFSENIFGLGLGTWGDYSATLNDHVTHDYPMVYLTDSAFTHILAEQGFILLIYLILLLYPLGIKFVRVNNCLLFLTLIPVCMMFTSMGASDTSWPTLYSFIYPLALCLVRESTDNNLLIDVNNE